MGRKISPFIKSRNDNPETMIKEVAKYVRRISKLNGLELNSIQVDSLTRKFLYKENNKEFFVKKEDYDYMILPTVKLESWLLERKFQEETS